MYKILGSDQKEYGPVTPDQLRQWIVERRLHAQSLVRPDGSANWLPLAQFPEFSATLAGAGPVSPATTPAGPRTNPMAITGLVMGILALFGLCCCYGFPFNILGIVFSCIALAQIKKNPELEQGRGLALAGLILSIALLVFALLVFVPIFGIAMSAPDILKEFRK